MRLLLLSRWATGGGRSLGRSARVVELGLILRGLASLRLCVFMHRFQRKDAKAQRGCIPRAPWQTVTASSDRAGWRFLKFSKCGTALDCGDVSPLFLHGGQSEGGGEFNRIRGQQGAKPKRRRAAAVQSAGLLWSAAGSEAPRRFCPAIPRARPVRCTEGKAVSPLRSATALQRRLFSTQTTSQRVRAFLAPGEVRADKAVRAPISPFLESTLCGTTARPRRKFDTGRSAAILPPFL